MPERTAVKANAEISAGISSSDGMPWRLATMSVNWV